MTSPLPAVPATEELPPLPNAAITHPTGWASMSVGPDGVRVMNDYRGELRYYSEIQMREYARAALAAVPATDLQTVQALVDAPSLYFHTGDIKDVNTLLVNRGELRALIERMQRTAPAAPTPKWRNLDEAMRDLLFQQARGIMGTASYGEDDALFRTLNHVFASPSPAPAVQEREALRDLLQILDGWQSHFGDLFAASGEAERRIRKARALLSPQPPAAGKGGE